MIKLVEKVHFRTLHGGVSRLTIAKSCEKNTRFIDSCEKSEKKLLPSQLELDNPVPICDIVRSCALCRGDLLSSFHVESRGTICYDCYCDV